MSARLFVVCLLIACGGPSKQGPGPDPNETPPSTKDPGAASDRRPLQPAPPLVPESGDEKKADGASCRTGAECSSEICEGEGCDENLPGKCMPRERGCTKDLRAYCGCDGKTFRASGSCPQQRFMARGECKGS